ncbi:hypothetical protein JCM3770_006286 [Rhodotorula araucariae]
MRASQQQQTPLRFVLWAFLALVTLYSFTLWTRSPLGGELSIPASQPGADLEVLGIGRHSATVVFVHGLRGSGTLGVPLIERIRDKLWQVSFLLPSAPEIALTAKDGDLVPAWFDIDELPFVRHGEYPPMPTHEDEAGMKKSVERLHRLIAGELDKGIDSNRIILAGFSQGCAISLLAALSSKEQLGGVMCLSGWLPMSNKLQNSGNKLRHPMQEPHAHNLPVFWGHGDADNIIAHNWAEESIGYLHKMGFTDVEFHSYAGASLYPTLPGLKHALGRDEEKDIAAWLAKQLPPI